MTVVTERGDDVEDEEDVEEFESDRCQRLGREGDEDQVDGPVGEGRQGVAEGADLEGEDLGRVDPADDAEGGEEEAKDEVHGDHAAELVGVGAVEELELDGVDEQGGGEAEGGGDEGPHAADAVEHPEADGVVDDSEGAVDADEHQRGLGADAEEVVDARAEVVDDVDAGQGREGLDAAAEQQAPPPRGLRQDGLPEAAGLAQGRLCAHGVADLGVLGVDQLLVDAGAEPVEAAAGLGVAAFFDEPAGGLLEEVDARRDDDAGDALEGEGEPPFFRVVTTPQPLGDQEPPTQHPLQQAGQLPPLAGLGQLGGVHGDGGGQDADGGAADEATGDEDGEGGAGDGEQGAEEDGAAAAESVGAEHVDDGAEDGAALEGGDDGGGDGVRGVAEVGFEGLEGDGRRDDARVEAEEEAARGEERGGPDGDSAHGRGDASVWCLAGGEARVESSCK
ncbi:hypothetical protein CTA1_7051 [Colletotrichum tanaceti]|uniref:Uncharacterized protein n=1 Tax=Colletotrichum tanaceti TaxID=1306861 RepID=A0A4U6X886_9PEZI|nr:hypothetical protein CTA1_7051 [Colletotrichum tanaceti]